MQNFYKHMFFGALYDFLNFQKAPFGHGADPVFQETKVIIVPVGLTGYQNVVWGMKKCPISVFIVFRCVMFYSFPITLFRNENSSPAAVRRNFRITCLPLSIFVFAIFCKLLFFC